METQREKDAADYLTKHNVAELLDQLSSMLFFYRPGSRHTNISDQLARIIK